MVDVVICTCNGTNVNCVNLCFMIKPSAQSKVHQAFGYEQGLVHTGMVHFRLNLLDGILNDTCKDYSTGQVC